MTVTIENVFTDAPAICDEVSGDVALGRKTAYLSAYAISASATYGFSMGLNHSALQACVSAAKVPILFLLTLAICTPTLHFIGLLFGSRIKFTHTLIVLLLGISVTCILLGAFASISLFFLVSGSEYEFLLLMHVAIFAFCGAAGLHSVHRNFRHLRDRLTGQRNGIIGHILKVWMLLYMFVGTQMAYNLSPFIEKESTFKLFGRPKGNFYTYVWRAILDLLLSGDKGISF